MVRGPIGREKGVFYEQERNRLPDPYISSKNHFPEPTVCPTCKLVYAKQHWHKNDGEATLLLNDKKTHKTKCPACRKIEDNYPMGVVNISGDFVSEHFEELVNLVKAEERRALEKNPLERLMKVDKVDGGIHVETTSEALALRIGRMLSKSYKGNTDFKFRYGDKYVIVDWAR
ncbi:MAG: hypothetical protein KJ648_07805 [Candidatus Omnitrophica bacterium]|nr:hypothetical protein [Candidatus Omnitrophota bacterium]